jgi:hypothetical protein
MQKKQIKKLIQNVPSNINDKLVIIQEKAYFRFYNPIGKGDWFVLRAKLYGNEVIFKGIVIFNKPRIEMFSLSELNSRKLPFDQKICWDKEFKVIDAIELPFVNEIME